MNLLTVKEAAARLNVTVSTMYALVKAKRLQHYRVGLSGGAIRIDSAVLDEYLEATIVPARLPHGPDTTLRRTRSFAGFKHLGSGGYRPKF